MGACAMTTKPQGATIKGFLRTEAFYLAVVLVVVALNAYHIGRIIREYAVPANGEIHQTISEPAEQRSWARPNADQKSLSERHANFVLDWKKKNYEKAFFPLWVERLKIGLLITGTTTALLLGLMGIVNSQYPRIETAGRPAWGPWDCLKVAACWSGGGLLLGLIFATGGANAANVAAFLTADIFGRALLVGVLIHVVLSERRMRLRDVGVHGNKVLHAILVGFVAFLVLQPIYWMVSAAQTELFKEMPIQDALQSLLETESKSVLILGALIAILAAPIAEELFFRGLLQPVLQKWLGPWTGLLVCAAFFSLVHQNIYAMAPLFALGVALGYAYNRTRSIAAPLTLHMLYNALAMLILFSHRYVRMAG